MKNLGMTICLVLVACASIGCDNPPTEYDHSIKGWVLWGTGLVDKAYIDINRGTRTFIIEFEGTLKVEALKFHNFNDIKEGTKGSIYKWPSPNTSDYYMWIPDKSIVSSIKENSIDVEDFIDNMKKQDFIDNMKESQIKVSPTEKQNWESAIFPPYYKTVLIKFKDGLTTTAYYTPTKKWKVDTDRRKMSGGIALKNVAKWKFIDLE